MAISFVARQNLVTQNLSNIYDSVSSGRQYLTVIAHISEGPSNAATKSWFETYPKTDPNGKVMADSQQYAGAHFGIEKNGLVDQFVDTQYICWGAGAANVHAIHVENVGVVGESLTDDQIEMLGNLLAWANQVHGIAVQLNFPFQVSADSQNTPPISSSFYAPLNTGLGFHAQYGGHPQCPGAAIVGQLPAVVQIAQDVGSGTRAWRMVTA
jgi:hypothetical protein